jgi:hypothetical protein
VANWNPFKPFVRSREEVAGILQATLNGTMRDHPWDDFICIPIKGTPEMEAIRAACEELAHLERIGDDRIVRHTPEGTEKIRELLARVKGDL